MPERIRDGLNLSFQLATYFSFLPRFLPRLLPRLLLLLLLLFFLFSVFSFFFTPCASAFFNLIPFERILLK